MALFARRKWRPTERRYLNSGTFFHVYRETGERIGVFRLDGGQDRKIDYFTVFPPYRGHGHAHEMFRLALAAGGTWLEVLEHNAPARKVYAAAGLIVDPDGSWDTGAGIALTMTLPGSPAPVWP